MLSRSLLQGALALLLLTSVPLGAQDAALAQARGGRGVSLDEILNTLDANGDGKIAKDEAAGSFAQRFAQWDADGDGFATRQEIHDYRERFGIDDAGRREDRGAPSATSRTPPSAAILVEPADWRLETMSVPPGFAPDVKLEGTEEIRFAPGMFDPDSDTYFTCVLAIAANCAPKIGAAEIADFLEKYYRGLSAGVGRRKGFSPDPAQMNATVNAVADGVGRFNARMIFFDSFSDGRKITLNVEAQVIALPVKRQTCLLLLVSPSARDSAAWQSLRKIGAKTESRLATDAAAGREGDKVNESEENRPPSGTSSRLE